jgi:hypothetical protein
VRQKKSASSAVVSSPVPSRCRSTTTCSTTFAPPR